MDEDNKTNGQIARELFLHWLCTPRSQRHPRTQIELARMLNVHVLTLSMWKKSPEFPKEFVRHLRAHVTHRIAESSVLLAQDRWAGVTVDRSVLDAFGPKPRRSGDGDDEDKTNTKTFAELLWQSTMGTDFPSWKDNPGFLDVETDGTEKPGTETDKKPNKDKSNADGEHQN